MNSKTVTRQRKTLNNTLHLTLTVFTCGTWLPVWIALAVWNAVGPKERVVTRQTVPDGYQTYQVASAPVLGPEQLAQQEQSRRIAARHAELVRKGKIRGQR